MVEFALIYKAHQFIDEPRLDQAMKKGGYLFGFDAPRVIRSNGDVIGFGVMEGDPKALTCPSDTRPETPVCIILFFRPSVWRGREVCG